MLLIALVVSAQFINDHRVVGVRNKTHNMRISITALGNQMPEEADSGAVGSALTLEPQEYKARATGPSLTSDDREFFKMECLKFMDNGATFEEAKKEMQAQGEKENADPKELKLLMKWMEEAADPQEERDRARKEKVAKLFVGSGDEQECIVWRNDEGDDRMDTRQRCDNYVLCDVIPLEYCHSCCYTPDCSSATTKYCFNRFHARQCICKNDLAPYGPETLEKQRKWRKQRAMRKFLKKQQDYKEQLENNKLILEKERRFKEELESFKSEEQLAREARAEERAQERAERRKRDMARQEIHRKKRELEELQAKRIPTVDQRIREWTNHKPLTHVCVVWPAKKKEGCLPMAKARALHSEIQSKMQQINELQEIASTISLLIKWELKATEDNLANMRDEVQKHMILRSTRPGLRGFVEDTTNEIFNVQEAETKRMWYKATDNFQKMEVEHLTEFRIKFEEKRDSYGEMDLLLMLKHQALEEDPPNVEGEKVIDERILELKEEANQPLQGCCEFVNEHEGLLQEESYLEKYTLRGCCKYVIEYDVNPKKSWGTTPDDKKGWFVNNGCPNLMGGEDAPACTDVVVSEVLSYEENWFENNHCPDVVGGKDAPHCIAQNLVDEENVATVTTAPCDGTAIEGGIERCCLDCEAPTSYKKVDSEICQVFVTDLEECSTAAKTLGLSNTTPTIVDDQTTESPPYCYSESGELKFKAGWKGTKCSAERVCICKDDNSRKILFPVGSGRGIASFSDR